MFGPKDSDRLTLLPGEQPEVLWITAIRADIVGADGETPESAEYFCHSVLIRRDRRPLERLRKLELSVQSPKMFTLVQGLNEIRFPQGFGMPVFSDDQLENVAMVMNPVEREAPVRVGVDSRIEYVRASELEQVMKPLFVVPLVAKVPLEAADVDHNDHQHGGDETCLAHDPETQVARSVDRTGRTARSPVSVSDSGIAETGHWYVPPGRHTYRSRLGRLDDKIPFDTKAHYISAHLHPFGESLELIDLTTGETVFKANAKNFPGRIAVEKITHYSSPEGMTINRSHEHEIVAVYDNTTDQDIDSMAVMYLYLHDSIESASSKQGG
jgi:hypothetical protein